MINQIRFLPDIFTVLDDSVVRVDLNHPMAGKLLKFDTEIVGIRPASAHELESGLHQHDCSCCGGCGDEHSCG
jgi:FKBP-type peptidyl-prolyl cis-trans isomerase SlyD